MYEVVPWLTTGCKLGEGPCYVHETQSLYFIDIFKGNLHGVNTKEGASSHKVVPLGPRPSVVVEIADHPDELLAGLKNGCAIANIHTGQVSHKLQIWKDEALSKRLRLNDGAVDSRGRLWVGSMVDEWSYEETGEGTLYRVDGDWTLTPMLSGVTTSNGLGWSPDDRTFYFNDSHPSANAIYAFDFEPSSGSISNQRVFFRPEKGSPDGLAVDINGDVWVALWDGWAVLQISARTGAVMRKLDFPIARPTCPCFGGDDFDELFVTSAAANPKADAPVNDLEGAVFKVKVGVKGMKKEKFVMSA